MRSQNDAEFLNETKHGNDVQKVTTRRDATVAAVEARRIHKRQSTAYSVDMAATTEKSTPS
jgi:hypothetical protein